ncbi:MAG: hypothetical protein KDD82_31360 [Planctomycetes bacterium]|nr:hypothetical protein [Planctomycetota bacterium]
MDPDSTARTWAAEILETQWRPARFRLELEEERWRSSPGVARQHYQARYRVWELAGLARVDRGPQPEPPAFPAETERLVELAERCAPPEDPALVAQALELARGALPPGLSLRTRGVCSESRRRGATRHWVVIEKSAPDGQIVIDYDPQGERRLGYLCGPFYRGSTRSAALSRASAVRRAQQVLGVPEGSRLSRARVVKGAMGRVWRLRWEVDTQHETGAITASLNARTGAVCVYFSTVAPRPQLCAEGVPTLERAAREIALAARAELGEGLEISEPIPTAVGFQTGAPRAAWVAVIRAPDRKLYRALHDGRGVRLKLSA